MCSVRASLTDSIYDLHFLFLIPCNRCQFRHKNLGEVQIICSYVNTVDICSKETATATLIKKWTKKFGQVKKSIEILINGANKQQKQQRPQV